MDFEYETDKDGYPKVVKSLDCNHRSIVRFINMTESSVEVYWINYKGKPQIYTTLSSQQFVDINTFASHPWIFKDATNKERLVINHKMVFRGPPFRRLAGDTSVRRAHFCIMTPLRTLKKLALLLLLRLIPDENLVGRLELPRSLEWEVKQAIIINKASSS